MHSRKKLRKVNDRLVVSWTVKFEVVPRNSLTTTEKKAVRAALREQELSVNPKFQVGAAAVAHDGTLVSVRNDIVGPNWHGEQRALSGLYAKTTDRRVKLIAMAGARPGENVISRRNPYVVGCNWGNICWAKPCGKCLEFIHDCTFNVPDVGFLSVAQTGQVVRTSLRSLITAPHTSLRVPIEKVGNSWHPVPSTSENKNDPYGTVKSDA